MFATGLVWAAGVIDTHAHLVAGGPGSVRADYFKDFTSSARKALEEMDRNGIQMALIMPTPQRHDNWNRYDYTEFVAAIRPYRDRFAFLGGGALLNSLILKSAETGKVTEEDRKLFIDNAEMILRDGAVGFGELAAEHSGLGKSGAFHSYQSAPPDHELLLLLADIAAPCNEEQSGQATRKACNRVRSVLTRQVKLRVTAKLNTHRVLHALASGQLRFLG